MEKIMIKRPLAIILMFFLMFATFFAGCGTSQNWDDEDTRTERRDDKDEDEDEEDDKDDRKDSSDKKDKDKDKDKNKDKDKDEDKDIFDDIFNGTEDKETEDTEQEVQEITWMFWDDLDASGDLITQGYRDVIDRFNKQYEGKYRVNPVTTNLDEYFYKLSALIYADECPDVFISDSGMRLTSIVEQGAVMDLTDILTKDNKEWYETFTAGMFEELTCDGKIMAVPANFAAALVYYNKEIFEKAGAKVPTTFSEWIDACEKIKAAGYTPISCAASTPWCLSMIAGYLCDRAGGPDNLDGITSGNLDWTSETYVTAANKLKELSNYFQSTAWCDYSDIATAAFYNKEAAMLIQGSWVINQIHYDAPEFEDKCGIFSFPAIEGGADPNRMLVKADSFCISATTENVDACVALLKMFTDDTAQKYAVEVGGKMPATKVAFDREKAPKPFADVADILEKSTGTFGFYNESLVSYEAGEIFDKAMVDIVLDPNCSVQEGLGKIQKFYEENVWK